MNTVMYGFFEHLEQVTMQIIPILKLYGQQGKEIGAMKIAIIAIIAIGPQFCKANIDGK